jgi:hypothetical protein
MGRREGRHAACDGSLNSLCQDQNGLDATLRISYQAFDYVIRRPNALLAALKSGCKA